MSCITGLILLLLSFSSLEATEYGLDYSWVSKTVIIHYKLIKIYHLIY